MKTNFIKRADNHEFQLLFYLALTFENEKKYSKAINYYQKFMNYVISIGNQECVTFCYNRIGICFYSLDDFIQSKESHQACLQYSGESLRFLAIYNLALSLRSMKYFREADELFKSFLDISIEMKDKPMK